jgi:hypothetical protein
MAAFGCDINIEVDGQEKPGARPGFPFPGSGGVICTVPTVPARIRVK